MSGYMPIATDVLDKARVIADALDTDVYLFNGGVARTRDLQCIDCVFEHNGHKKALLITITNGGDPDAAYKIARYFQDKYESFSVLVSGMCKSAGTLLAIGAHELIFTPFGELGPLDIQLSKVDRFDQLQSGLTVQEALDTLERRATLSFYKIIGDYIRANNGLMSFATASKAASDFVTQLYAPVFSRIDPEEVGARSRSMRIATEYGQRLSIKSQNLKDADALKTLAETYSSHSFVIDQREAERLFKRVRSASEQEKSLVAALGRHARFEQKGSEFVFVPLSTCRRTEATTNIGSNGHGQDQRNGGSTADGRDSAEPAGATDAASKRPRRGRKQSVQAAIAAD